MIHRNLTNNNKLLIQNDTYTHAQNICACTYASKHASMFECMQLNVCMITCMRVCINAVMFNTCSKDIM